MRQITEDLFNQIVSEKPQNVVLVKMFDSYIYIELDADIVGEHPSVISNAIHKFIRGLGYIENDANFEMSYYAKGLK
ncbi:MAG: hypothetical protein IKU35_09525 [Bacteroidaceae bacterium]|nr:hypothetical protein [Bacteroidaceae bacterium]